MIDLILLQVDEFAQVIQSARAEVRLQAPTVDSRRVLRSLKVARAMGAKIFILLGAHADYEIDNGRVLIGRDPYANSRTELNGLADARAQVLINPRFSNLGAKGIQPGRRSTAAYTVVEAAEYSGKSVAYICTGGFSDQAFMNERNRCARTSEASVIKSLVALHRSEFDDTLSATARASLEATARQRLVVTPGSVSQILAVISSAGPRGVVQIRTSEIATSFPYFPELAALGPRLNLQVPASNAQVNDGAVEVLTSRGAHVELVAENFAGTTVQAGKRIFVGSHTLTDQSAGLRRDVGIVFDLADGGRQ